MNEWISAAIAIAAGLLVGSLAAAVVRRVFDRDDRPEALRNSARPLATLAFSLALIIGLVVALGFVSQDAVDDLDSQVVDYTPRAISAAIVLIVGNIAGTLLAGITDRSLGHVSPALRRRVPPLVKGSVLGAAGLIAAQQLGIDTTILTLAAASVFFTVGLALALMVGLGSRQVSSEVAAGRAVRRLLSLGDRVAADLDGQAVTGTVVDLHPVAVELETAAGRRLTVPNSSLLRARLDVERSGDEVLDPASD